MRWAVYNVLGEKMYGLNIGEVRVNNLLHASKEIRNKLINLQQLPEYFSVLEMSSIVVNKDGMIEKRY